MSNILYITPEIYLRNQIAGGMGTKTRALKTAWGLNHNIDVASELDLELVNLYDVIIIELLGFRKKNKEKFDARIEALKAAPAPKFVYGSDSEVFRWPGEKLDALKAVVTAWIPNCHWQSDYFMDFDLPVVDVVHEPIDCDLFRPGKKEKHIIAAGTVSHEKNSVFFIELFSKLKEMNTGDYQTVYVGSAGGWGNLKVLDLELQKDFKKVTDVFHGQLKPEKVAKAFGDAAVGVLNPFYETCNRIDMELFASGTPRVCGPHILYDERPDSHRFTTVDECIGVLEELTSNFVELPSGKYDGKAEREYAVENFSYEASCGQLNSILDGVN